MTACALLLAAALLLGAGPLQVRVRAGAVSPRGTRRVSRGRAADPISTASALDVLAVCLTAGMPVSAAAAATAPSALPPLRPVLERAAELLALGADADTAWSRSNVPRDNACEALMRLARRSASSGSALAQGIADLAEQSRQEAIHAASASAQRAGVLLAGPLGLCFLPAFVCLGIVPVVAGLAADVFGDWLP